MTDYGNGLKIDWTPEELAKIEMYKNEQSRRGCGVKPKQDALAQVFKEVWKEYAGFESNSFVGTINKRCGIEIHKQWNSARDYVHSKQHT